MIKIFPPPGESQVCKWRAEILRESWHPSAFTEEQKQEHCGLICPYFLKENFREHCPGCLPELFYFRDVSFKFLCRSRTGCGWWQMWPVPPSYCCSLWGTSFCSPLVPGDVVQGAHTHHSCVLGLQMPLSVSCIGFLQFAMNHWCLLGTHTRFWLFLLQCYNGHKDT